MPRIASPTLSNLSTGTPYEILLTIYGSFQNGFGFEYSKNRITCKDKSDSLSIALYNGTSDGSAVEIHNFASTAIGVLKPNPPTPLPFPDNTQSVNFGLTNLQDNQLVDFAMFVVVTSKDATKTHTLLCDPQIGNDPD